MMYKLYLQKNDRNQATSHYIDIIVQAAERNFGTVECVDDVKKIKREDIVIVIAMYSLISVIKHRFYQPFVYWFQGIHAEETVFNIKKPTLKLRLKKRYMAFWEWFALHRSRFNIFVSDAMRNHYRKKYRYKGDNYYIMPCYNQNIERELFFTENKYKAPSIVFAGALLSWQCIDELFRMYTELKKKLSNASLTILTKDRDLLNYYIKKYNAKDVHSDFVPLSELNKYMSKFKYGYLLRSDDAVNNVATPTKFNSYLAVGIIPIVSRSIHAYQPILDRMKYCIDVNNQKDIDLAISKILELEKTNINPDEIFKEYNEIFDTYYNTKVNIENLSKQLNTHK